MTRFARAQGSKSSNERVPHEATSWAEMKQQLTVTNNVEVDDSKKKAFLDLREKNYKNFLSETAAKQTNTWVDFGDVDKFQSEKGQQSNDKIKNKKSKPVQLKKNLLKNEQKEGSVKEIEHGDNNIEKIETKVVKSKEVEEERSTVAKKKKSKTKMPENVEQSNGLLPDVPKVEKVFANEKEKLLYEKKVARRGRQKEKVKQRKEILAAGDNNRLTQVFKTREEKRRQKRLEMVLARKANRERLRNLAESALKENKDGAADVLTNTQKRKQRKIKKLETSAANGEDEVVVDLANGDITIEENTESNTKKKKRKNSETNNIEPTIEPNIELNKKAKKIKIKHAKDVETPESKSDINGNLNNKQSLHNNNSTVKHQPKKKAGKTSQNKTNQEQINTTTKEQKPKNLKWTGEHRKKPMGPKTTTLHLNGRSIEVALFDGFPVRLADHERLTLLRKEMVSKGVPRSEVQRAMQLERRRAEKAFAREKKEVCFHCRKAGHKLTECPEALTQETEATGICFKCGSTEHTHFQCKVVQQQQFKFATCFICREAGHIAKQCPQNARGIYPQGGSCKVCGDVTHLKKDCPQYQAQQEHHAVHADTIDGDNLEALDLETPGEVKVKAIVEPVKKAKVVKF